MAVVPGVTVRASNEDIARMFDEMADLLALQDANPFRVRAYRRAALGIRGQERELADRVRESRKRRDDPALALDSLPGIGADLAAKIVEIVRTGRSRALEQLRRQVPAGLPELLGIPGLGPKRVKLLHERLGISGRKDLARAVARGSLSGVPGIGPKLTAQLARALNVPRSQDKRWLRPVAAGLVEPLAARLSAVPGVEQVAIAGSYRRGRDTVGDIDLVVGARDARAVSESLHGFGEIAAWELDGPKRISLVMRSGLKVDLRIGSPAAFGAALHYFTGSKQHNIHLRRLAQDRGLKINEYGVFRGRRTVAGETEESVFAAMGLPWIPSEMREDQGEIELARAGKLPRLVAREDLRGDLHSHTGATTGRETLEAMARAAQAAGLRYLAITDRAGPSGADRSLDERRLRQQMAAIDRLNGKLAGLTLLKGVEVDILEDGRLALPDGVLEDLDVVVAAIHSHFDLSAERQTRRVLRAMEHRAFAILGHPGARLIGEREPVALDFERVCAAAKARGCCLELNGQPQRLDLDDVRCRLAREHGVLISIASDARDGTGFANLDYGVTQARRGWLGAQDVLNTRPLAEVRRILRALRSGARSTSAPARACAEPAP